MSWGPNVSLMHMTSYLLICFVACPVLRSQRWREDAESVKSQSDLWPGQTPLIQFSFPLHLNKLTSLSAASVVLALTFGESGDGGVNGVWCDHLTIVHPKPPFHQQRSAFLKRRIAVRGTKGWARSSNPKLFPYSHWKLHIRLRGRRRRRWSRRERKKKTVIYCQHFPWFWAENPISWWCGILFQRNVLSGHLSDSFSDLSLFSASSSCPVSLYRANSSEQQKTLRSQAFVFNLQSLKVWPSTLQGLIVLPGDRVIGEIKTSPISHLMVLQKPRNIH